ncbi:hypothetical protein [Pseudodesulfovibrio sp.]|uniref:hypothetical protein n=1 Tax=Pseudodesulfovibrio sp. TaxID=2035812 RepID=UPI002611E93B|nr:hypothetical protein [Pseudodesulfovibrio sp.]MDD3310853.1 hypothetical protein [Pseudodesulfovibrio sp.]
MPIRKLLLTLALLLALPGPASAFQGYVQPVGPGGTIAWGDGELTVARILDASAGGESESGAIAVRKAVSGARKQLLDMILGIRVDARSTVGAYLSEDDEMAARVRGAVQNSPLKRPALFAEGGEIRVSESLRGKLAELVLPTTIQFQSGIPPKLSTSMEQRLDFEEGEPEHVGGGGGGYTGVVIDARGLKVTPALAPVVYGQDGQGAYGPFLVSRQSAIDRGVAAYASTADPVALRERVGSHPLVIKAVSAYGSWRTDLIVPTPMARLVRAVMRSADAVDNCRLVIVLDPPAQPEEIPGQAPAEVGGNA